MSAKTVVLGITSGIAAYKSVELVKLLKKEGVEVFVVMTTSAAQMVDPKELEKASGNKVFTDLFEEGFDYKNILKERKVDHIDLADKADVICIAPATANVIAKITHGIADDFLTTMLLAANSPVVLSPSMNVHMWTNPATQENIRKLQERGIIVLEPERGMLACGYEGPGRLPHLQKIKQEILQHISYSKSLSGKKVLVTAGGTSESIDAARVITNKSSGKMGIAIAEECLLRGADVVLLRATNAVEPRYVMPQKTFETSAELQALIKEYVKTSEIFFHTAAVSDFIPSSAKGKLSSKKEVVLTLKPQKKIISEVKKLNPRIFLVGFKAVASSDEKVLVQKGKEKLQESDADVIVVNDISQSDRGFQADANEVYVVTKKKSSKISLRSKKDVARELISSLLIAFPQKS